MTLLVLPLLFSTRASAECDGDKCSVALKTGEAAPFDGVLLSQPLALETLVKVREAPLLLELEKKQCTDLLLNEQQRCLSVVVVEQQRYKSANDAWNRLLKEEQQRAKDAAVKADHAEGEKFLWGLGGVAAGAVAALATLYVVSIVQVDTTP